MDRKSITIRLAAGDVASARFAVAPAHELIRIVRALVAPARFPAHRSLLRTIGASLPDHALDLLTDVVTARGFVPDFLAPQTEDPAEIAPLIAATPVGQVSRELDELLRDGRCDPRAVRRLAADPERAAARLAEAAAAAWSAAVDPLWPAMLTVLRADIRSRAATLVASGFGAMVDGLHPSLSWDGSAIRRQPSIYAAELPAGRGLILTPTIFGWPNVQTSSDPAVTPTILYPARNATSEWHAATSPALADLLGRTRARALAHLDYPATVSDTAAALGISVATAHHHLRVLAAAGLVDRHREGSAVWHVRTDVGDALSAGS